MKIYDKILLIFLTFYLSNCASTKLTSFKDPDYKSANFKRILVVVNTYDLEKRLQLETAMVKAFEGTGIYALEGFNLFPPTRVLSDEEKVSLLIENNIDAYISVLVGESGIEEIYVPPTSSTTKTKGNVSVLGNTATYEEKSKTTYQGGYTLSKPWAEFETKLYDVSNGRTVWISASFTGGNVFASFNTVINSFSNEVINRLENEELILTNNLINKRQLEQKIIEEDKRKKELEEIIKKRKDEAIPPEKKVIYLKNNQIIKGFIISTEKQEEVIIRIVVRNEDGELVTLSYDEIEKIEKIK